ncbi:anoctamin-8 isoform X2 [Heterocephalus glaber]|uniref:Anoctamin n=1 Tax=Heterocephalus glaber TaxID=10181 RepID=A0AAX6SBB8_HETGA|nr:anoctamin-8 isoform X2 [Heterocephalus glaber]
MKPREPRGRAREPVCPGRQAGGRMRTRVTGRQRGSRLDAGGDEKQSPARGRSGAGGRGLCLLRSRPHAPAAPRRPGRAQPLTQLAMAEPASGAGGADLYGERGKRPPPEGEPSAPASGVLDKLFGKRLLQAGRYLVSHKAWMKTVPTENCDVLMTFPDTTDDHTLLWLLNHIRMGIPELIVQVRHHRRTRAYAFFVTATYESLLRGADELGLRKAVKAEFGGGTRGFSCEEDFIYENVESELRFFTSQERQSIIRFWLQNLRAKQGEALHNVRFLEDQPIIPELAARGIIQQVFPVHEQRILNRLMKSWVQAVCENQPLDDICDYFGVKIAMYFAWLGFYTSAMVYPAVFGSVLYTFTEADQTSRDVSCVVFALFNVIWSTLFLEEWKRRGAELAYKWGTLDSPGEAVEEPRPQFRGVRRISPVTRAEEFYYPPWKRLLFQLLVSLPLCLACLACVFLLMLGCFQLQELVLSVKGLPRLARFLPKVVLALLVSVSAEGYKKLAIWLNDMENYRLESAYEKHLIIKVVLFQFVNSYLSLFYIGFYLKDMERLKELLLVLSLSQSLERQLRAVLVPLVALRFRLLLLSLRGLLLSARAKMLATLLITHQFLQNVREVLQPHLYGRLCRGELGLRALAGLAHALLGGLSLWRPTPCHPEPQAGEAGSRAGGRRCLGGGCGAPEEEEETTAVGSRPTGEGGELREGPGGAEERDEGDAGREDEEDEEDEEEDSEGGSLLDCGLRLKKVSFAERGARQHRPGPSPEALLEEGSPTMVEKGLEPGVFTLGEDEEEAEGPPGSPEHEPPTVLLRRAGGEGQDQGPKGGRDPEPGSGDPSGKQKQQHRSSWIDPPEEEHLSPLTQAELESCMKKYEFGYVVLFSSAFPLAALCALVNNLIEIRSDAFKLCTGLQRPFGQRVESIGQWQKVMEAMGVLAIVVNCYLIGQCGQLQRLFPWLSPEAAIVSVVVLEHFALLLKYLIHVAVPDIPGWVAEEMAKLEYQRREAFKRHERQAQHRYQQQQRRRREEEERQRHAEHHARREREAGGREEARAEVSGLDAAASEKTSAKAKGSGPAGHGQERPKRPGLLLAPNNVMKLKQIIPLQSKFLSSGATASPAGPAAGPTPRPTPAQSPTGGDTRLPAFLSFKFLKSPEARRDPERSHSPPKAFYAAKLFPFGGARAEANGAGSQPRPDTAPSSGGGRAPRSGPVDEALAEEREAPQPEEEGSGTAPGPAGAAALRTRCSRSPPPRSRPPTPPAGCWQWDPPWGCGGEAAAPRPGPPAAECPPCALAAPALPPQPLPGDDSFYSLLPPLPEPPAPDPIPSPQAACWPSGWH